MLVKILNVGELGQLILSITFICCTVVMVRINANHWNFSMEPLSINHRDMFVPQIVQYKFFRFRPSSAHFLTLVQEINEVHFIKLVSSSYFIPFIYSAEEEPWFIYSFSSITARRGTHQFIGRY